MLWASSLLGMGLFPPYQTEGLAGVEELERAEARYRTVLQG